MEHLQIDMHQHFPPGFRCGFTHERKDAGFQMIWILQVLFSKTKQEAASVQLRFMKQTRRTNFDETSYVYGICCIVMSHYQMVPPSPKLIHPFAKRSSSCSPDWRFATGPRASTYQKIYFLEVICRLTGPPKKVAFWYFHIFLISSCYLQRFFLRTGVQHHATFKLHHCKKQDKIRRRGRSG